MKGIRRCIDYAVVRARNPAELCGLVLGQLHHGWEPVGGIAVEVDLDGEGTTYYQAMAQFTDRAPFT